MLQLESRTVDKVGNNEDIVLQEYSVPGGMAVCRNALHASFKRVACLEQVQMSLVGFEYAFRQLAPVALHSEPCVRLKTIKIYRGIRDQYFPFLQQTAYVVGSLIIFGWRRIPLSRLGYIQGKLDIALGLSSVVFLCLVLVNAVQEECGYVDGK